MTLSKSDDLNAEKSPTHNNHQDITKSVEPTYSDHYHLGNVEFSGSLENSVPLEAPRVRYVVSSDPLTLRLAEHDSAASVVQPQPRLEQLEDRLARPPSEVSPEPQSNVYTPTVSEETISLLEERLVVNLQRRKVGEVIIRKEVETLIIEVPVRREKLIVEEVSPEYKQLAVVDLGQASPDPRSLRYVDAALPQTVSGEFVSVSAAIQFLKAIAADPDSGLQTVQISLVLEDAARCAASSKSS